jgi:hypothetical protein
MSGQSRGASPGVSGFSTTGHGVVGTNASASGSPPKSSSGVWGDSADGYGVYGASRANAGVQGFSAGFDAIIGEGGKNGVHGISASSTDSGVWGENTGAGYGVSGFSSTGHGVLGTNGAPTGTRPQYGAGVWGDSANGYGVYGASSANAGVQGFSAGFDGVHGESSNPNHAGVSGMNTSGHGIGVFGSSGGEAGHFEGAVTVNGDAMVTGTLSVQTDIVLLAGGQDFAEQFELAEQLQPGTVVVIDRDGALRESDRAYDKKVAGVISGAGSCRPGIVLGKRATHSPSAIVALVGRVYCNVDARASAIDVGDLLVSSDTPGHAMKASDVARSFGAVIGKALEPCKSGRGVIPMLVTLQ